MRSPTAPQICQRCHENSHQQNMLERNVHMANQVSCSDCHRVHVVHDADSTLGAGQYRATQFTGLLKTNEISISHHMTGSALRRLVNTTTMASADFCQPIPAPLDAGSTWQVGRPPRVRHATFTLMPVAFTTVLSVQVSGFEDICLLTQYGRLLCDFCSSGQCFACGFLQIPPRGGHPCCSARSSCHQGLQGTFTLKSLPGRLSPSGCQRQSLALRAMPGARRVRGEPYGAPLP